MLFLAPRLVDGLRQQPRIQVKADDVDVPALPRPQQIARPSNLQVAHRDSEPGPQLFAALQHRFQPTTGIVAQHRVPVVKQITVAPLGAAPHPPTQLIKLCQPKMVGPVDKDRVGVGNVQPVFDDRGGDQHIDFSFGKPYHHLLHLPLGHLPMSNRHHRLWHQMADPVGQDVNVAHPVVDHKNLPPAVQLTLDRLFDQDLVVFRQHRMDRLAFLGRRVDGAHVPDPAETHVQCARDRRGAQRQDIYVAAQLFELFFLRYPKTLLLIDDQQPQLLELNILAEQPMCAHHQIHCAFLQPVEHFLLLSSCAKTAQDLDPHRVVGQPPTDRSIVLLGQHRRRYQKGHLFAVLDRLEGRPHGNFGLAIPDVPTDQPIHRTVGLHIPFDCLDRHQLIFGLLIGESRLHLLLPGRVRAVDMARHQLALGIELDQILCNLGDRPPGAFFDLLPVRCTKPADRRCDVAGPHIAAETVGLVHWHIELVFAGVADQQVFTFDAAQRHARQPLKTPNALFDVHHKVARLDIGKKKLRRHLAVGLRACARLGFAPAKQFSIREQMQIGCGAGLPFHPFQHKPFLQDALEQAHPRRRRGHLHLALHRGGQLHAGQQFLHPCGLAGHQHQRMASIVHLAQFSCKLLELTAKTRAGCKRTGQGCVGSGTFAEKIAVPQQRWPPLQQLDPHFLGGEAAAGKSLRQLARMGQLGVQCLRLHVQCLQRGQQIEGVVDDQERIGRQMLQQRNRWTVHIRKIPLDAMKTAALRQMLDFQPDRLPHRQQQRRVQPQTGLFSRRPLLPQVTAPHPQTLDSRRPILAQHLTPRPDLDRLDRPQGALAGRVEKPQAVHFFPKEVDAQRG